MELSKYELESGHRATVHENCTRDYCAFCDGGLFACTICGGLEGSLLPTCPGRRLTFDEDQANYEHYCARTGPFEGQR